MTVYFCDSSALVKCYVQEQGSAWMRTLLDPTAGHHLYLASITGVEVIAAVTRRLRRGDIAATDSAADAVAGDIRRGHHQRRMCVGGGHHPRCVAPAGAGCCFPSPLPIC